MANANVRNPNRLSNAPMIRVENGTDVLCVDHSCFVSCKHAVVHARVSCYCTIGSRLESRDWQTLEAIDALVTLCAELAPRH